MDILNNNAYEPVAYENRLDKLFDNPMRRKIFSLDFQDKPYYKPILFTADRIVREEDEDYLLDIIGKSILQSSKWTYGVIPDEKRKSTDSAKGNRYCKEPELDINGSL